MIKSKLPNSKITIFSKMSALANEYDAVNLGQGFPNFESSPILLNLVDKYLKEGRNQYAPMPGVLKLREALSRKIENNYHCTLDPSDQILITAGATQAIFTILTAFIYQNDEVILFEPAYDCYKPTIEINGGIAFPYKMEAPDFRINWEKVRSMITPQTKMIIINTPHNPTGSILLEDDLIALEEIVVENDLILLSDEVYEHLIYDGNIHQSVLSYPKLLENSIAVYSFGKTFHNTGWKIGYCCGPKRLMREVIKIHQWNVFSVNSFLQYALAEYLEDEETYLSLPNFYQLKRDAFNEYTKGTSLKAISSKGTYFQLFDYSEVSDLDDVPFAELLVKQHGIASIPVSVFYSQEVQQKVIRFCFAKTDDILEKAGNILRKI